MRNPYQHRPSGALTRQAPLLRLDRSSVYHLPKPSPPARLMIMHRIDALHLEHPFAGNRMLREALRAEGLTIGRLSGQRRAFSQPTSAAIDTEASG